MNISHTQFYSQNLNIKKKKKYYLEFWGNEIKEKQYCSTFLHVALAIPVKWLRQTTTADLMRASYTSECCLRHPLLLSGEAAGSRAHLAVIEADKSQGTDPAGPRVPWLTTRWWSTGDLLSPSLPLCKQREHHLGFLIVFTSMRTSKNLLRGYFFSFLPRWDIAF